MSSAKLDTPVAAADRLHQDQAALAFARQREQAALDRQADEVHGAQQAEARQQVEEDILETARRRIAADTAAIEAGKRRIEAERRAVRACAEQAAAEAEAERCARERIEMEASLLAACRQRERAEAEVQALAEIRKRAEDTLKLQSRALLDAEQSAEAATLARRDAEQAASRAARERLQNVADVQSEVEACRLAARQAGATRRMRLKVEWQAVCGALRIMGGRSVTLIIVICWLFGAAWGYMLAALDGRGAVVPVASPAHLNTSRDRTVHLRLDGRMPAFAQRWGADDTR